MSDAPDRLSGDEYRDLDGEGRAMVRCFVPLDRLPREALEDMRSLSIHGSSLARQIVDEGTASPSALMVARHMIKRWEEAR